MMVSSKDDFFAPYSCTYDARFESMRDYPRKKQIYRNHVDMEKQCEKTIKHLKGYQRVVLNECNRDIQKMQERFSKLMQLTLRRNTKKSPGLWFSYNKWARRNKSRLDTGFSEDFNGNIQAMMLCNQLGRSDTETNFDTSDVIATRHPTRLRSHRSVSVDNIPTEIEKQRGNTGAGHVTMYGIGATLNRDDRTSSEINIDRQMTSISLNTAQTSRVRIEE